MLEATSAGYRCRECGGIVTDPLDEHNCADIAAAEIKRPRRAWEPFSLRAYIEKAPCQETMLSRRTCGNWALTEKTVLKWVDYQQVKLRPYVGKLCQQHARIAPGIS